MPRSQLLLSFGELSALLQLCAEGTAANKVQQVSTGQAVSPSRMLREEALPLFPHLQAEWAPFFHLLPPNPLQFTFRSSEEYDVESQVLPNFPPLATRCCCFH